MLYRESGFKAEVELQAKNVTEQYGGKWEKFNLKVIEVIDYGPFNPEMSPKVGDVMHVERSVEHSHYAGWSISED